MMVKQKPNMSNPQQQLTPAQPQAGAAGMTQSVKEPSQSGEQQPQGFLQQTAGQMLDMAQGAGTTMMNVAHGAGETVLNVAHGAGQTVVNVAQGATDTVKNSLGGGNQKS